jgi:hypothetical protein
MYQPPQTASTADATYANMLIRGNLIITPTMVPQGRLLPDLVIVLTNEEMDKPGGFKLNIEEKLSLHGVFQSGIYNCARLCNWVK